MTEISDPELLEVKRALARYPGVSIDTLAAVALAPKLCAGRAAWRKLLTEGLAELLRRGEVKRTKATGECVNRWWPAKYEIPPAAGREV